VARLLVLITMASVVSLEASAASRSLHAAPKVMKCPGGCTIRLPLVNHDGYPIVHAWAVAAAGSPPNRTNILKPPAGVPGAQYLGSVKMSGPGTYELTATIRDDGGHFGSGMPIRIFTGWTLDGRNGAHVWGESMPSITMVSGP